MMLLVIFVVGPGVVPSKIYSKQYLLPYKSKMCSHCADSYRYNHHRPLHQGLLKIQTVHYPDSMQ